MEGGAGHVFPEEEHPCVKVGCEVEKIAQEVLSTVSKLISVNKY